MMPPPSDTETVLEVQDPFNSETTPQDPAIGRVGDREIAALDMAAAATLLLSAVSLSQITGSTRWAPSVFAGLVLAAIAGTAARVHEWTLPGRAVAALAAAVIPPVVLEYLSRYALNRGSLGDAVLRTPSEIWHPLLHEQSPVEVTPGLVFGLVLLTAALWLAADLSRTSWLALTPAAGLFITCALIGSEPLPVPMIGFWVGSVLAWAGVRRMPAAEDPRRRQWVKPAITLAVTSLVVAGVFGPYLPGANSAPLVSWFSHSPTNVSPLVEVGGRLRSQSNDPMFTVNAQQSTYWQTAVLSDFDGSTWLPSSKIPEPANPGTQPLGDPLGYRIHLSGYQGATLPLPPNANSKGNNVNIHLDYTTGLATYDHPKGMADLSYQTTAVRPPIAAEMSGAKSPVDRATVREFTALPHDYYNNTKIGDLTLLEFARDVTKLGRNDYEKMQELEKWFRENFTYDLAADYTASLNPVTDFIATRRGYCQQFAGTFAVLARAMGYPTRLAAGFSGGTQTAPDEWTVKSSDAHAWPEVRFNDLGWVSFEPTPGRLGLEAASPIVAPPTAVTVPVPVASAVEQPAPSMENTTTVAPTGVPAADVATNDSSVSLLGVLVPLAVMATWVTAVTTGILAGRRRRHRRHRRQSDPRTRLIDAWEDCMHATRSTCLAKNGSDTPIEWAAMVEEALGGFGLGRLAERVNGVLFGAELCTEADCIEAEEVPGRLLVLTRTHPLFTRRARHTSKVRPTPVSPAVAPCPVPIDAVRPLWFASSTAEQGS